jgi:tRNA A37 methylthiotransferase MiaB
VRAIAPDAGARSNVIVGFPGETDEDVAELEAFLGTARLDAVGVFGYSDEEGTEAAGFDGKLDEQEIAARVARVGALAEELMAQRAEERIGDQVAVLVEDGDGTGRAAHQGPDSDGITSLSAPAPRGAMVAARVVGTDGVDLVAEAVGVPW